MSEEPDQEPSLFPAAVLLLFCFVVLMVMAHACAEVMAG